MKAVFTTKVTPVYDDVPEHYYHFPRMYLRQVERAIGDWILYYEPIRSTGAEESRGGRKAYFATAKVEGIRKASGDPDHFYADVSNYLGFERSVPFKQRDFYYESGLQKSDGSTNKGAFGRAVRNLPDEEFDLILQAGFSKLIGGVYQEEQEFGATADRLIVPHTHDERPPYAALPEEADRRIIEQLTSRPFRDSAFAASVKEAYENTCAMTGLKIINGGGRSEAQAAHIRPVAHQGPDSVRNGIALSGTLHWMFDRGLVSVDEDYSLLSCKGRIPDTVERLFNLNGRLLVPRKSYVRPHQQFLEYHREHIFKG